MVSIINSNEEKGGKDHVSELRVRQEELLQVPEVRPDLQRSQGMLRPAHEEAMISRQRLRTITRFGILGYKDVT